MLVVRGDTTVRRVFRLHAASSYNLVVMLSAWPGRIGFHKLRFRRLSGIELASVAVSACNRLLGSRNKLWILKNLFKRYSAGQSLGFSSRGSTLSLSQSAERVSADYDTSTSHSRVIEGAGLIACIEPGVSLHRRALEIVAREFVASPLVEAAYCDIREGYAIKPVPRWDTELAKHYRYAKSALFFRASNTDALHDPWGTIAKIADRGGQGVIARVALPLAFRQDMEPRNINALPMPKLVSEPKVSIIIPTKYRVDLLKKCLEGVIARTGYANIEVIIVDNGCTDPALPPLLEKVSETFKLITVVDKGDFNFPRLIASGAKVATGDILLMMNDDIEPIEPGWLHRMVESASAPAIGAVGVRLVYPDHTIQHAGIMLGLGGCAGHLWKGTSPGQAADNSRIVLPSRRMAVTGACLAVKRDLYEEIGGMDAEAFPISLNDVDFCLKLEMIGRCTIYRGDAVLIHHESQSRGDDDQSVSRRLRRSLETRRFLERWQALVDDDPFGSPAFDSIGDSGAIHPALMLKRSN